MFWSKVFTLDMDRATDGLKYCMSGPSWVVLKCSKTSLPGREIQTKIAMLNLSLSDSNIEINCFCICNMYTFYHMKDTPSSIEHGNQVQLALCRFCKKCC